LSFGDEETGIRTRLLGAIDKQTRVEQQLSENQTVLECLRALASINGHVHRLDSLIKSNDYLEAARVIKEIGHMLDEADAIEGTKIKNALLERVELAQLNVRENAFKAARKLLEISVDKESAAIRVSGIDGREPGDVVRSLFGALEILDAASELREAIGEHFIKSFVRPVLSVQSASVADSRHSELPEAAFVADLDDTGKKSSTAAELCGVVTGAISFVNKAFEVDSSLALWDNQCGIDICSLVIERCFLNTIPTKRCDLAQFSTVTDSLVGSEKQLAELKLLGDESRPISLAVSRLDEIYATRRCDAALKLARTLAQSSKFAIHELSEHEIWSADFVNALVDDSDCEVAPRLADAAGKIGSGHVFPKCTISQTMSQLVAEAYRLVNEAAQTRPMADAVVVQYCLAACNLFDLYRLLYPVLHRAELSKIPSLAWQFFSDCMYASHHARILQHFTKELFGDSVGDVLPLWQTTSTLYFDVGNAQISALVQRETKEIRSMVDANKDGFLNASDEVQKGKLERMAKQVRLVVTQLAKGMRPPVTTPHIFYSTLGRFADAAFGEIIDNIVDIRDIGVDDSQVLSDHCRTIYALTGLFQLDSTVLGQYADIAKSEAPAEHDELLDSDDEADDPVDGSSSSAKIALEHCMLGNKLLQLADILLISRADILARRRAGLLAQFAVDDLVNLIRALFSETPERAQDIEAIRNM
ncbi:ribosome biogenesis protein ytm1, partial [Linderina pennispora]